MSDLSRSTKIQMYITLILPIVMYGSESWELTKADIDRPLIFEWWVLRIIRAQTILVTTLRIFFSKKSTLIVYNFWTVIVRLMKKIYLFRLINLWWFCINSSVSRLIVSRLFAFRKKVDFWLWNSLTNKRCNITTSSFQRNDPSTIPHNFSLNTKCRRQLPTFLRRLKQKMKLSKKVRFFIFFNRGFLSDYSIFWNSVF